MCLPGCLFVCHLILLLVCFLFNLIQVFVTFGHFSELFTLDGYSLKTLLNKNKLKCRKLPKFLGVGNFLESKGLGTSLSTW